MKITNLKLNTYEIDIETLRIKQHMGLNSMFKLARVYSIVGKENKSTDIETIIQSYDTNERAEDALQCMVLLAKEMESICIANHRVLKEGAIE